MGSNLTVEDARPFMAGQRIAVVPRRWWKRQQEATVLAREGNDLTVGEWQLERWRHFARRLPAQALYRSRRRLADWIAP